MLIYWFNYIGLIIFKVQENPLLKIKLMHDFSKVDKIMFLILTKIIMILL